jgi:uncharacterized protein
MKHWRKFPLKLMQLLLVAIAILFATSVYAQGVEPRWLTVKQMWRSLA